MRKLLKFFNRLALYIASFSYKQRKLSKRKGSNPLFQVNLACGLRCLPGWTNVDGSLSALLGSKHFPWLNKLLYKMSGASSNYSFDFYNNIIRSCNFKFYNLKFGVPMRDNSTDIIYCSHFLEHLRKNDGRYFLKDCYRALKHDGLLRIVVPDLDIAMKLYKDGDAEKVLDLFFYNSENWDFSAHKYNYNFLMLKMILEALGYRDIKRMSYQEGVCPDMGYLDVYPEFSLYIECNK